MSLNLNDPLYKSEDFHHVGIVVKDIEKTIEHLEASGIGPFGMSEGDEKWFSVPFKGELHGKPAEWTVKISSTRVGDIEIELLEPSGGESVLQEFLDEHGEGVHHIAYLSDNVKADMEKAVARGEELLTCANLDTRGFAYLKTREGGAVIEIRFR
jgi:catechol 2,3-dioxygenase-like lactoylglutathione lyase family enzyme